MNILNNPATSSKNGDTTHGIINYGSLDIDVWSFEPHQEEEVNRLKFDILAGLALLEKTRALP